ncbi:glycosyltransferase [Chryseobacterium nematophagum]|uniref:Glycosyltransferase n=1 Tax=Chryseobacterium nematophagum TaxID=2305228 RepID=A0A3M7LAJ3_9FLAO|nr:glycosyltransferase [Chryseobacterium nematophagum]RMZ59054.1 glycosyltransferase [Chryseobacterium nematophagum]
MRKRILFRIYSMERGERQNILLSILNSLDIKKYEPIVLLDIFQGELLKAVPAHIPMFFIAKGEEFYKPNIGLRFFRWVLRRTKLSMYHHFPKWFMRKMDMPTPDIEIAMMDSVLEDLIKSPFKKSRKINWFHSDKCLDSKRDGKQLLSLTHQCDMTIFISHLTKSHVERCLGTEVYNGICIRNLYNVEEIKYRSLEPLGDDQLFLNQDSATFVSVGSLDYQNGYNVLIEAHWELMKEGIDHRIIVIGDGPDYSSLKKKIKSLGIENSFHLLGNKENPYPYIVKATCYIQPLCYRAYSLCVEEAIILGKPVISTYDLDSKGRIFQDKTGLLINFSKYGLKKGIKKFLLDTDFVTRLDKNLKSLDFSQYDEYACEQLEGIL